jgi:isoleucyl-tRNA synthetase
LQRVLIPVLDPAMTGQFQKVEDLIKSEVNVKELQYLTDTDGFIHKKIRPNFIALGKKLGPKMKAFGNALRTYGQPEISRMEKAGGANFDLDGETVWVTSSEVDISSEDVPGWMVASKGPLTVALDVTVTPELEMEGHARELVNRIQKIRKDQGFALTDRIGVEISGGESFREMLSQYNRYICAEILADRVALVADKGGGIQIEVNEIPLTVFVFKKA